MVNNIRAKKRLGQHFLKDDGIAARVGDSITAKNGLLLEIGPGMGALTKHLIKNWSDRLWLVEIDDEAIPYLISFFPDLKDRIIHADFLKLDLESFFKGERFSIIGNFPYNISTQILFKALEYRDKVIEVAGMFQKEVAKRICSPPGNKDYGILSVLIQAYFDAVYLFDVPPSAFIPPPAVNSGVIRLKRKNNFSLSCNDELFKKVVKTAFNQRRKKLSNALSSILAEKSIKTELLDKRAEQLSWKDFEELTRLLE
ncbi:MAG: 16S rRNA (adenine(1518)-N(6)/adenine(1519)-N(6))-dimethyltransferase RsmA [Bacteroidia bacterium]